MGCVLGGGETHSSQLKLRVWESQRALSMHHSVDTWCPIYHGVRGPEPTAMRRRERSPICIQQHTIPWPRVFFQREIYYRTNVRATDGRRARLALVPDRTTNHHLHTPPYNPIHPHTPTHLFTNSSSL